MSIIEDRNLIVRSIARGKKTRDAGAERGEMNMKTNRLQMMLLSALLGRITGRPPSAGGWLLSIILLYTFFFPQPHQQRVVLLWICRISREAVSHVAD